MGKAVQAKRYSPVTVNNWLGVLRVILTSAVSEYGLPRNPVAGIEDIDTSTHFTYTEEEPNSLLVEEVPVFLAGIRRLVSAALRDGRVWVRDRPPAFEPEAPPAKRAGSRCALGKGAWS